MRAAINKKSTTTEPSPYNGHQPKPPGGGGGGGVVLKCINTVPAYAQHKREWLWLFVNLWTTLYVGPR